MTELEASLLDTDQLKSELPIPYVLEAYGYNPVRTSPGKLHYLNPWRDDTDPSLDVYFNEEGIQRIGDMANGFQGGVIDVIELEAKKRGNSTSTSALFVEARSLYKSFLSGGYAGPTISASDTPDAIDPLLLENILSLPLVTASDEMVGALRRGRPGLTLEVLAEFGVRRHGYLLAMPYPDGTCIAYRDGDGNKSKAPGSKLSVYHAPGITFTDNILLVEGETDTWAAHASVGSDYTVLGIPGSGNRPEKFLKLLEDSDIVIAFDGDKAGRAGALEWSKQLTASGCSVTTVPMPDGADVASMDPIEFERLVALKRKSSHNNTNIEAFEHGYGKVIKEQVEYVSNWKLLPVRLLEMEDKGDLRAYEVRVNTGGKAFSKETYILRAADMASANALHRWCGQFSGSWYGGSTDHMKLRAVLEEQATYLPVSVATRRPGLVGNTFVFPPDGRIGTGETFVVPDHQSPMTDADAFSITPGPSDGVATLFKMLDMHEPAVIRPLLAWLALAPLRSRYTQFPPLFVHGRAGSGKTTIVRELVDVFSGVVFSTNLTGTTPYALTLTMGGTNAYPTWFDEYRPGAGEAVTVTINQLIRDAYNAAPSRRGGMGDDKSQITAVYTYNPLLISGEDFADEQSHRDRIIRVEVPKNGKGTLPEWTPLDRHFAHDYLTWLTERPYGAGDPPVSSPPKIVLFEGEVSERQAYNIGAIKAGWTLLGQYVSDRSHSAQELPSEAFEFLIATATADADTDPVLEQLNALYEHTSNQDAIWADDQGTVFVSPTMALAEMRRAGVPLPFRAERAFLDYLVKSLGGRRTRETSPHSKKQIRYIALSRPWKL